jgi:hypothetical protein
MSIITDPDLLDRNQVIFNTASQKISLLSVGSAIIADKSDGATTLGSNTLIGSGLLAGSTDDILIIKNGSNAGHYIISNIVDDNNVELLDMDGNVVSFLATENTIIYGVYSTLNGTIQDGVKLQAVYSFAKEEWRNDIELVGGDDLIKHEFPFEPLTSESFEIGGTVQHANWTWASNNTRKLIRTGGFADKNTSATLLEEWTSVVTLGFLDPTTRTYYQQVSATEAPVDFTFNGPVNEVVQTFSNGVYDRKNYLKLFARKKGFTYAEADISDIGVDLIQPIANRFPLSHTVDSAIEASDAEILGSAPFSNQRISTFANDFVSVDVNTVTGTFSSASSTFITDGIQPGDTISVVSGTDVGFWTILSIDSETQVTVDTEEKGPLSNTPSQSANVTTSKILTSNDGNINDIDGETGLLTSATGGFLSSVQVNDYVRIVDNTVDEYNGIYRVSIVNSDTELTLVTSDKQFNTVSGLNFEVVEPGMFIQYKKEDVPNVAPTNYVFDNVAKTITRSDGTWDASIVPGTTIEISSSSNELNNGTYSVLSRDSGTQLTMLNNSTFATGTDANSVINASNGFIRNIGGSSYGYNWRLLANGASLSEAYEFVQYKLRQSSNINEGPIPQRGDITDLLMQFDAPLARTSNLIIDNLTAVDANNVAYEDVTGTARTQPFVSALQLQFNVNLQNDPNAKYWLFFSNDDAGDNTGRDFSTKNAIIVQDSNGDPIEGSITGQNIISFTYDYDGNNQRGAASVGTDAPVTLVAIGLDTAQYIVVESAITRSTSITISAASTLERNYVND